MMDARKLQLQYCLVNFARALACPDAPETTFPSQVSFEEPVKGVLEVKFCFRGKDKERGQNEVEICLFDRKILVLYANTMDWSQRMDAGLTEPQWEIRGVYFRSGVDSPVGLYRWLEEDELRAKAKLSPFVLLPRDPIVGQVVVWIESGKLGSIAVNPVPPTTNDRGWDTRREFRFDDLLSYRHAQTLGQKWLAVVTANRDFEGALLIELVHCAQIEISSCTSFESGRRSFSAPSPRFRSYCRFRLASCRVPGAVVGGGLGSAGH